MSTYTFYQFQGVKAHHMQMSFAAVGIQPQYGEQSRLKSTEQTGVRDFFATAVSRLALHNPNRCVVESGKNTATVVTIFSLVHSFLMGTVLIFRRLKSLLVEWTIADCQLSLFVSM